MEKGKRILSIDDLPSNCTVIKGILETKGFEVLTASHPRDGLKLLSEQEIDLLILDIVMPDLDGIEVRSIVLRDFPRMPVLFISAVSERSVRARIQPYDIYLQKPFNYKDLFTRVAQALAQRHAADESPAEVVDKSAASTGGFAPGRHPLVTDLYPYIIGGLLHDARNTMFAMREKLDRMQRIDVGDKARLKRTVAFVAERAESLDRVMDVIHQISQEHYTDESHVVPEPNERVAEFLSNLRERWPQMSIAVEFAPAFEESRLPVGVKLLVIRELLLNAATACETAGSNGAQVSISGRVEEGSVAVICGKNSDGLFPDEKLAEIQDSAVRPGGSTGKGTGHGLYFISEIAKRLGGRISAKNLEPSGASVEVWLPLDYLKS